VLRARKNIFHPPVSPQQKLCVFIFCIKVNLFSPQFKKYKLNEIIENAAQTAKRDLKRVRDIATYDKHVDLTLYKTTYGNDEFLISRYAS
jgi:hypothetical protein